MRYITTLAVGAALALGTGTVQAQAQGSGIPVRKSERSTAPGVANTPGTDIAWVGALGYTLRPGALPVYCSASDAEEAGKVAIKQDLYQSGTMISPDQAKALALCAVPGQISSGEMQSENGRTWYDITLLPTDKKTYTKIQIDAMTGEVINAKQFGGLRGLAGFLRESAERKENKRKAPNTP
jgi:hypothetical protein